MATMVSISTVTHVRVVLIQDLRPRVGLVGGVDAHGLEDGDVLLRGKRCRALRRRFEIRCPPFAASIRPLLAVAVAGKDDLIATPSGRTTASFTRRPRSMTPLSAPAAMGMYCKPSWVGRSSGNCRTRGTRSGSRRTGRAPSGSGFDVRLGGRRGAAPRVGLAFFGLVICKFALATDQFVDVGLESGARVERNDRRRRSWGAQPVVVARACATSTSPIHCTEQAMGQTCQCCHKEQGPLLGLRVEEV